MSIIKPNFVDISPFRFRFPLYYRKWHASLHQANEFHPNETTYCGNMTIYLDSRRRYNFFRFLQELSYRQQITRQLRTQYADGIYRHKYYTVTLKSRLRVTQGHRKRNHWIDHTRLSSSRVI